MEEVTIIGLYEEYLDTKNLIEIIIGVFEVNYICKHGENTNGKRYSLVIDKETKRLLDFLCNSWSNNIRATIFKSAIEEWINTGCIPFHLIPKKDFQTYVRENRFLQSGRR